MENASWYTQVRDGGCALGFRQHRWCRPFRVSLVPSQQLVATEARPQVLLTLSLVVKRTAICKTRIRQGN
eukprot:8820170-Prorocentrum_lima.AAC.1